MPYQPILGTLAYVLSKDKNKVLMIHRNKNPEDHHYGKYNGIGGKLEPYEDVLTGCKREIWEEAGIECRDISLRGTISWPGFGKQGEPWFGFIFIVNEWSGDVVTDNPEGTLEWVAIGDVLNKNLWEGDKYFIPFVFDANKKLFHGVMPYHEGKPTSWDYQFGS